MAEAGYTHKIHDLRNIAEGLGQAQELIDAVAGEDTAWRDAFHFGITEGFEVAAVTVETDVEISSILRESLESIFDGTERTAAEVRLVGALAGSLALLRGLQGEETHE